MKEIKPDLSVSSHKNILTDLDTIFDTRLSLAYILDTNNIIKDIKDEKDNYRNRILDNFGNISNDIFMQIYNKRTKFLLKNALPTNILDYIKEQYVDYNFQPVNIITQEEVCKLYLNIYPYNLTEDEQKNIVNGLSKYFGGIDIIIVYKKFIDISPIFLIENKINMVILYELFKWLELIVSEYNILKTPITHIYTIGPVYLNPKKPANNKIVYSEMEKYMELFNIMSMMYLVPLKEFSAIDV